MANQEFFEWQTPEKLRKLADIESDSLGALALKSPGREFREAFVASRFAQHRDAAFVRLLPTRQGKQTPDFAILVGGDELWFETTEIDRPNRRRGDEPLVDSAQFYAEDEWSTPEELCPTATSRIGSKVSKNYDKCDGLVIWFNAFPVERSHTMNRDWWEKVSSSAKSRFAEVWVHQHGGFTRLF